MAGRPSSPEDLLCRAILKASATRTLQPWAPAFWPTALSTKSGLNQWKYYISHMNQYIWFNTRSIKLYFLIKVFTFPSSFFLMPHFLGGEMVLKVP